MFVVNRRLMAYYTPTLSTTTGWTFGTSGTPSMSGGIASMGSTTSDNYYPAILTTPALSDRYYVQCTLDGATTSEASGLLIRTNTTWTQQVVVAFSSSYTDIKLVSGATAGTVTTEASSATVLSSSAVVQITCALNSSAQSVYSVYQNGSSTAVVSWTDTGGATSIGASYRYGGLLVQRASFANSVGLENFIMADY